ncbi:MAG TPA: glycoside hydrolase family 15 protein, partial [Desulfuromonadaceae bacterium]
AWYRYNDDGYGEHNDGSPFDGAGTGLARQVGVEGYYVRIAPPESADAPSPATGFVPIKNRPSGEGMAPAAQIVSPDALALVRFGLRSPDDPRIVNTVRVIDALLKKEMPSGPAWYRYNDDGYGEHDDGSPFDGAGIGRPWPLLVGERAHYELAAGRHGEAERLREVMAAFANESGLIPEQIWDGADLPERELFQGRPSGSAAPLVWAHAEYLKLCRSLRDGRVFDMPQRTVERYRERGTGSPFVIWRFSHKCRTLAAGRTLRLELAAPATVRWSGNGWRTAQEATARDTGLGLHVADLATSGLSAGALVVFTFYWQGDGRWEGVDYTLAVR